MSNAERILERKPPQAIEAEAAVLGAVLLDAKAMLDAADVLAGPEDFYRLEHAAIYTAALRLFGDKGVKWALIDLRQLLDDRGELEQVGGLDYLIRLAEAVPDWTNCRRYAELVRSKAKRRAIADAAGKVLHAAYGPDADDDVIVTAEREIFVATRCDERRAIVGIGEAVRPIVQRVEAGQAAAAGLLTGWHELDSLVTGLKAGDMYVLAARPSIGKTAVALAIAHYLSLHDGRPVAFASLEMTREQLGLRLLANQAGVNMQRITEGTLTPGEQRAVSAAGDDLRDVPLLIDDDRVVTMTGLAARLRRLRMSHGIELAIVDYLQLLTAPGCESRFQEVSTISRELKRLAGELEIPVLVLSQLNRLAEGRSDHRPMLSDLRESGQIEQDADAVLLLHRPGHYSQGIDQSLLEIIAAKNRNGPTGTAKLTFDLPTGRIGQGAIA
jgi:replicative DNA helicase